MAAINGTSGNDTLNGTSSSDTIKGLGGNDILNGGDGDDTLIGGAGADQINGGNGFDWASYETSTVGLVIDLNTGALSTGDAAGDTYSGIESYVGSSKNDTFIAGMTTTIFDGGSGSDDVVDYSAATAALTLNMFYASSIVQGSASGAGGLADGDGLWNIDRVIGTAYNDVYTLDAGAATRFTITEAAGGGIDEVQTTATSYTLGANLENLTYTGTAGFTGTGNGLANIVTGGSGNDILSGGAGNDSLLGGLGDDSVIGGAGADILDGGDGFDWASYATSTVGLVIDLNTGALSTGDAAGDTYIGIESYVGSSKNDTFIAGMTTTIFDGGGGSDDVVDYSAATAALTLNLFYASSIVQGSASGAGGLADGDGFWNIDRVLGTAYDDVYTMDAGAATRFTITEAAGGGIDEVQTTAAAYTLGANLENLTNISTAGFTGTGNGLANVITGNIGGDTLIGGAGADTLIGGDGWDWASYATSTVGLVIDLDTGALSTGDAAGDTYSGIESFVGSSKGDIFIAGMTGTTFDGGGGSDDVVDYSAATAGLALGLTYNGSVVLGGVSGAGGLADGDGFYNIDRVIGTAYDDVYTLDAGAATRFTITEAIGGGVDEVRTTATTIALDANVEILTYTGTAAFTGLGNATANTINGGIGNDLLLGGGGADTLNGGDGFDLASYANSTAGITFDLANGSTGEAAGDVYTGIEGIRGTTYADLYYAGAEAFFFDGGSSLHDRVSYEHSTTGVTLDMTTGIGTGIGSGDTFASVEEIVGSNFDDNFTGTNAGELFFGTLGADTVNGGGGVDTMSYEESTTGVTAYLSNGGTSTGDFAAGDVLTNIEDLIGSDYSDVLYGDSLDNTIDGGRSSGVDLLYGGAGKDDITVYHGSAYGGDGHDILRATSTNAYLYGGEDGDEYHFVNSTTLHVKDDGTTGTDTIWLPFFYSSTSTSRVGDDLYVSGSGIQVVLEDWFNGFATMDNFVSGDNVLFHIDGTGHIFF